MHRTTEWIVVASSFAVSITIGASCDGTSHGPAAALEPLPGERHFRSLRQLTNGGENAEAYWSSDGKQLILQSTRDGLQCDQIFTMNADGSNVHMVSTGKGHCTCSYFFPDGKHILFSSTHLASPDCPPKPDYSHGYVWAVYPGYDVFTANPDGSDLRRLTDNPGYDAESTISTDGKWIVFTSLRDGDLDLYKMRADGTDVTRLTDELGYDGGAFFSRDGSKIVYRAFHPTAPEAQARYRELLATNMLEPRQLDLWVMDADGSHKRQITNNGAANFGPYFFPDGKRIIFASNVNDPKGRNFDLYAIDVDGSNLEQLTVNDTFDGFPMFSPDGKRLVFASNRHDRIAGETNIFVADWID
ncbi:MAG: PD40 domain-containing protein [Planctomycetes bacterium]|nr:PD40 domain-containing protein [Planctomycetota bacterium]MBI3847713.1 PD40 domain-containing protein [Planctomycetota bacterium]